MNLNFTQPLVDKNWKFDLPEKYRGIFFDFAKHYAQIAGEAAAKEILFAFGSAIASAKNYSFSHFHTAIRSPLDFYALGLDLFRPLVDKTYSKLLGINNIRDIQKKWDQKENIFLFANHQSEADPQLLSLLLEAEFPELIEKTIFVAGERVITDPLAVPLSMGRSLLCIYSKKYFDIHKEKRTEMQEHNKKAIQILSSLLDEGGKCIYIAPSGGRDRPDATGRFRVAPFDPQSIQLCRLLGSRAKRPTHFYPLALYTHTILPPPDGLQAELGEKRIINRAPIGAAFGEAITFPNAQDKEKSKQLATDHVWTLVNNLYEQLT